MQTPIESKQNCYFFSRDKRKEKPIKNKNKKPIKTRQKKKPNFYSIQLNHWLSNPEKRKKRKTRETHQLGYLQQQQQKVSVQERERKKNLKRRRRKSGSVQEKKKKRGCQNEKFDVESSQMNEKSPLKFD